MKRANTIVSALAAVLCTAALPAAAQVVVGESPPPDVQVNWSALDRLGPAPTLPGMLQGRRAAPAPEPAAAPDHVAYQPYADEGRHARAPHAAAPHAQGQVTYRPYAPEHHPAPPHKHVTAKKPPTAAKAAPATGEVVKAAHSVETPAKAPPPVMETAASQPAAKPTPAPESVAQAEPVAQAKPVAPANPEPAPRLAAAAPVAPPPVALPPTPAAEPAPPVAVAPPAPPPPVAPPAPQIASLPAAPAVPTAPVSRHGDTLSVLFEQGSSTMPDGARGDLAALAQRMLKDDTLGLQLLAYARPDEGAFGMAHRLSLSRALGVRDYLKSQGVNTTRIEVRAMGSKQEGSGPADRVDAVLVSR